MKKSRSWVRWAVLTWFFALVGLCPWETVGQRAPDVPYVPTPYEVVEEMLKMAKVGPEDVVYDLGCGDGRIVITAAQKYGARGVGVDIDPRRIQESRANAEKAGVTDRVRFIEGDLFEVDIREATVVTLYLLPDVNLRLRPKLLRELRPGTRIVSHDYDMGEWEPDDVVKLPGPTYPHTLYYWVVPASVEGTWRGSMKTASGERAFTAAFRQQFQKLQGSIRLAGSPPAEVSEGRVTGDRLRFRTRLNVGEAAVPVEWEGQVVGDTIGGRVRVLEGPTAGEQEWTARRVGRGLDRGGGRGLYIRVPTPVGGSAVGPMPRLTSGRGVVIFKLAFPHVL